MMIRLIQLFRRILGLAGLSVLFLSVVPAISGSASRSQAAEPARKNVLIILSNTPDFPATRLLIKGIQEGFSKQSRYKINYNYEYLNLNSFAHEAQYLEKTAEYFQWKYSRLKPDIVVTGAVLTSFMLQKGKDMFPGIPVLFASNAPWGGADFECGNCYVVSTAMDFMANIALIRKLRPGTKRIFIVAGATLDEQEAVGAIADVAHAYREKTGFVFLDGMSHERMLDAVGKAEEPDAVLFVRWAKDADGKPFVPAGVVREVVQASRAPVFVVEEHFLGSGAVGGYAFSFELLGQCVSEKALDVLDSRPETQRVRTGFSASGYVFDARALRRFGIGEPSLPPGSQLEFKEQNAWELYKEYIVAGFALILLEAFLIIGLVINRARRKKVEAQFAHLNESLEAIVRERTEDLSRTNHDLELAKAELERMNKVLDHASRVDSLTGLHNRRHMDERIHEEFLRFTREGEVFAIILADIDYFKRVNDTHGHDAGDSLLVDISKDISESVREYDIVSRWGGEEFMVLLPGTQAEVAVGIAERIRRLIERAVYAHQGVGLSATLTLGVCGVRAGDSLAELFKRADEALYEGKRSGRNRIVTA